MQRTKDNAHHKAMSSIKRNERHSRQILVLGKGAQNKLRKSKVAVLGLGALGSVAAELLARAGIGRLTLIDRDVVEISNLGRQILYAESDVGKPKAEAAFRRLRSINSAAHFDYLIADINHKNIEKILKDADIILDCTDNLYTRFLLNDFGRKRGKAWIYAAAIRERGSVMLLTPKMPCFRCTFKEAQGLDTCDTAGITNPISTAIAAIEANEAIHYLTKPEDHWEKGEQCLIRMDFSPLSLSEIKTRKNPGCPACRGTYEYLEGKKEPATLSYRCSGTYQFFLDGIDLHGLKRKLEKIGTVRSGKGYLFFKNISAFGNGRVIIRARSIGTARSALARYIGI